MVEVSINENYFFHTVPNLKLKVLVLMLGNGSKHCQFKCLLFIFP